ncbi:MAG: DUF1572 family protein [Flavobacteriales bacterium]
MEALDFLDSARKEFRYYRSLGERAMAQLPDADLFKEPAPGNNSIAVIVQHLHGNMLSRWTEFLTSDGEKAWRDREGEFDPKLTARDELMARWNKGWDCLLAAIDPLTPADLERTVRIRTEPHSVAQAIARQLAHVPYHVGQIVLLAKLIKGESFQSLSIPRGGTAAFNRNKGM